MSKKKKKKEAKVFTKNARECQKVQNITSNLNTLRGRKR
jgi:hypothetical protein